MSKKIRTTADDRRRRAAGGEDLGCAVRVSRQRSDRGVAEESPRRDLGLNVLDEIWARQETGEDEANELALEALAAVRRKH